MGIKGSAVQKNINVNVIYEKRSKIQNTQTRKIHGVDRKNIMG